VLAATIGGSSLAFLNGSTVGVALPELQRAFAATVTDLQWIVNAYMLTLAALILPGGALGDRYGRRRVFVWGVAVFAAASLWCALAPSLPHLLAARALQGVGGALLTPGSLAILSASFPAPERGRAIGLWSGFSTLGAALGPLLGGWLVDALSWRWIFWILLPLAAGVATIALWRVPESRDPAAERVDVAGAAVVVAGLAALNYALIAAAERGFRDPRVVAALAGGVLLLGLFLAIERRSPQPMVPLDLFRSRPFSGANAMTLLLYAALSGALLFLPLDLIQVQGYSATAAGAALLPMILITSGLASWFGGLVPRLGPRPLLVAGPLVAAAGFALFLRPGVGGSYWTTFFPALVVLGLGMAITIAPLTATVMGAVGEEHAGTASGINNAVARVASLLAVAVFGLVMTSAFAGAFRGGLAERGLPEELAAAMELERLAAATPPESVTPGVQARLVEVRDAAFVAGFRTVMGLATALAVASAIVAWATVGGSSRRGAAARIPRP
jgi:EmrB/QacA subfamily drug resistance transporter